MRRVLVTLKLAALAYVGISAFTPPAWAYPDSWWIDTYYSDATYSTAVGSERTLCDGRTYLWWGYKTEYVLTTAEGSCNY